MMRAIGAAIVGLFVFQSGVFAQSSAGDVALPDVIVYKTKGNYKDLVPVLLSPDRKRVVSYPDPVDLRTVNGLAVPVALHDGYLLDRKGVGWHSAFIKLTYEEYSKLKTAPSADELYDMIVDKNPMTAVYDCGGREPMKNMVHRLNDIIDERKIKKGCSTVYDEARPTR